MGRHSSSIWSLYDLCKSLQQMVSCGHWARILNAISEAYDGDIQMIGSSSIRVHQHAANGQRRRKIRLHGSFARRPDNQNPCIVDADGRPIRLKLTAGQAHDGRSAADMFETLGSGQILLADRVYDSDSLRQSLKERGALGPHPPHDQPCEYPRLQSMALQAT